MPTLSPCLPIGNMEDSKETKLAQRRIDDAKHAHDAALRTCKSYERALSHATSSLYHVRADFVKEDRTRSTQQLQSDVEVFQCNVDSLKSSLAKAEQRAQRTADDYAKSREVFHEATCARTHNGKGIDEWRRRVQQESSKAREPEPSKDNPRHEKKRANPQKQSVPASAGPPPKVKQPKKEVPPSKAEPKLTKKDKKPSSRAVNEYFKVVDAAFADYSTLKVFPKPLAWPCSKAVCQETGANRALEACECNIRELFEHRDDLKAERLRFHPDKMSRCPPEFRENFQRMAKEVFVVVDEMHRKKQAKAG